MKKLLMLTNYFYPEVATTGQLLTELAEELANTYKVTVITEVPAWSHPVEDCYKTMRFYHEEYKGIEIWRVRIPDVDKHNKISRIKYIFTYFFNTIVLLYKLGKYDFVYAVTQPPILGGILGRIAKYRTGGKLMYTIMDANPEQVVALNYTKNKWVVNAMMWFDKKTCLDANVVVTLGKDMEELINKRFVNDKRHPRIEIITNWIDETAIHPVPKTHPRVTQFLEENGLKGRFVIMTSGNIGLFYDFENIIKIFENYKDDDSLAFVFVGDGAMKPTLVEYKDRHSLNNVFFLPYQPKEDLVYSLNAADIHIVTNAKGIKGISVPSKTYGIMATNVPIWGILEEGSEAWRMVKKSNCGILCHAGNYDEIRSSLDLIIRERSSFVKAHETGRAFLLNGYTKKDSIEKYINVFNSL